MQNTSQVQEYNAVAKFLHWAIALLIVANYISGLLQDATGHKFINLHKQFGMSILLLVILRLVWKFYSKYPKMADELSVVNKFMAKFGHLVLYIIMLAIPIAGMLLVESKGYPLQYLGFIDIPVLISEQTKDVSHTIKEIHEYLSHGIIIIAILHALFALKHHFIDHGTILLRMMPSSCKKNK